MTRETAGGYAYWSAPDGSARVVYSLETFGEIDAAVNDGFRRIPRGGVETGGVLFGTREANEIRIEAVRPIECQHALGPSFVLSETDREKLREQLQGATRDEDLHGLVPVGWFVGHTRSSLAMSEREIEWFDEFFPGAGMVTVLAKPERFQPTRFAFLVRGTLGEVLREPAAEPVILPLSKQAGAASQEAEPSIPAPKTVETKPLTPRPEKASPAPRPVEQLVEKTNPVEPAPSPDVTRIRPREASPPAAPDSEATRVRAPRMREPISAVTERTVAGPAEPTDAKTQYPYARLRATPVQERRAAGGFGWQSIAVLLLAAVLGCLAGYWAYLQLPSPVIPVSVREQSGQIVVEWPAVQTAGVDYAALQVNDGQWVTLSTEQKDSGRATIRPPAGDLKIDLVAKHWLRDSRGIVRYLRRKATP